MKTHYILIDYENVQPRNLAVLKEHSFKVMVFVGANQTKIPFELAETLQALGTDAEYVKMSGNGPNALDFHIAYYIGELAAKEPKACFHIVSKDSGFDPLIRHLTTKKIRVFREKSVAEIAVLRISNTASPDERLAAIVKRLVSLGQCRPRKVKTLTNTINALSQTKLAADELSAIITEMKNSKLITVDGEKITYRLPSD
ncbi:MAG: hypothetical protein HN341_03025 [Verrucomicrobia bacterium]|jgi:hypothetical protein|nr:hypothetical protein [Verrucomicrobiota bacterium]